MIISTQPESSNLKAEYNFGYIWLISTVAALGGLLFGWDWVVIGGAKTFFEPFFGIAKDAVVNGHTVLVTDQNMSGWANSCALLGCLAGSLLTGILTDKFGRKRLLMLAAFLFAASSVLTGWASTFDQFILWRVAGGVAIGMASNLSPLYIAEIAPAQMRGRLVALNQLTIVVGILAAQLFNMVIAQKVPDGASQAMIAQSWNGQYGWRWMFTLVAAPSLLFFVAALFVPESPRWLVKNGSPDRAKEILARIGGQSYAAAETDNIRQTIAAEEVSRVRLGDLLKPRLLKILLIGCALAVFQQWCGINVIFNYAQEIFHQAGYDISDTLKNIAWTGSVNLVATIAALGASDRFGRRPMLQFGEASLAIIYTALGFCYHSGVKGLPMLLLVLAAIACYAMSLAPVTWVVISEIFPNRIRGTAISVAVSALWIACFLLTFTFPKLNAILGAAGTFWLYAVICVAGFIFVSFALPETKGKTLEQIERELTD